jgi:hypothetical protein
MLYILRRPLADDGEVLLADYCIGNCCSAGRAEPTAVLFASARTIAMS